MTTEQSFLVVRKIPEILRYDLVKEVLLVVMVKLILQKNPNRNHGNINKLLQEVVHPERDLDLTMIMRTTSKMINQ